MAWTSQHQMLRRQLLFGLFTLLSFSSFSQSKQLLTNTFWSGTHSPIKKGSEIFFQGDTLYLIDMEGIKPPDTYLFRQKKDTVSFYLIDEFSFDCRDEAPGLYKISWANNGEKLLFKPIHDPCIPRFTQLISESPWFRKRETRLLRNDWYFLDPEKDKEPGISVYETYKWLKFRQSHLVTVALISGNVDQSHEDLKENLVNPDGSISLSGDKISTQMAGIIGAKRGNGKGVDGLADNVKIMALDAWQEKGQNYEENVASSLRFAAEKGVKIAVLVPLKPLFPNKGVLLEALKYADKKGMIVFYPFDNQEKPTSSAFPPNLIPVSHYGQQTSLLSAPGDNIFSTTPLSTYESGRGTDMACAIAGGMAAVISSYFPKLTSWQIRQILIESGKTNANYPGLVNLKKAYDLALKLSRKK